MKVKKGRKTIEVTKKAFEVVYKDHGFKAVDEPENAPKNGKKE